MAAPTFTDLTAQTPPWYVAHRGNYTYHPEHTLVGYYLSFLSVPDGLVPAVEVSVRRTADNQIICMHDQALTRTTTDTANVEDRFYLDLKNTESVDIGAQNNGPAWANQPIPLLGEVLDVIGNKAVIFLEPKAADADSVALIFSILDKYSIDPASIVWKFNRSGGGGIPAHAGLAAARGHALWAYLNLSDSNGVVDATATALTGAAPTGGAFLGVPIEETDVNIAYVVGKGLDAVVSWEVHRRSERDRLDGLGVTGMMCPQEHYVRDDTFINGSTQWSTGVREPGLVPKTKDDWANTGGVFAGSPTDWLTLNQANGSILLGSISPGSAIASTYTIDWRMKWDTLPSATLHSDFIFSELDDRAYGHQAATNAGGYHAVFRVNGDVQLFKHVNGSTSGTQLGATVSTTAPTAGQEVRFQATVTSTTLTLQRVDPSTGAAIGSAVTSNDTTYRGGYFHIARASADQAPSFKFVIRT